MNNSSEKLSLSTKLGYGAGDIFGGGAMTIIGFYYLYFLTDIVKISPALAGLAFLISKIWDAVSDPLMGMISDQTRTRFGRRRPYFLAGIILIFLSFFLMWFPVDFSREMHRFIYVCCAYIFFSTVITMVMVPYNALASELTVDYNERTSLATFRMVFSGISGILCATVPLEVVRGFDDVRTGYMVMAVCFGLFFALPYIGTFFTTFERKEFQREIAHRRFSETITFTFIEPFKVRSFRHVMMMYIFSFLTIDSVMAIVIYFMTYYIGRPDQLTPLLATLFIMQIVFLPISDILSKKTSKRTVFMGSVILWMLALIYSFIVGPDSPLLFLYLFGAVLGIASAGNNVTIFAMFPDIPDIDELKTGERREGIYSGLFTFMRKASSAIALFLISGAIHLAGYLPPVEQKVAGAVKMIPQEQSDTFIIILRLIFALAPMIFLAVALINCIRYPLSPMLHERLRTLLSRKRGGESTTEMIDEEKELKGILIGTDER